MAYTDKSLDCVDCGASFIFSASEQDFYATKGFTNEPKRCPECRASNKQRRGGYGSRDSFSSGRQKEMHPAVCATCGKDTQVPFKPRRDRPVYCSDCYTSDRR